LNARISAAQIALDEGATLVHDDRDFDAIATVRPLKLHRLPRQ
jgi:predicted nucleic acid-binding protein